jgi:adenylate cyclase
MPDIDIPRPARIVPNAARAPSRTRSLALAAIVAGLLLGLPVAVWLDIRNLSEHALRRQADDLNSVITSVRSYYAKNVVGRVLAAHESATQVSDNYASIPGAIPIPATLSLELGKVISEQQQSITYRFVSDYPFAHRAAHELDAFERQALATLRTDPHAQVRDVQTSPFGVRVRAVEPIVMGETCVACHNSHPDSPKRDWKVGDVRGIQEISIAQPFAANILSFKYLLLYFFLVAGTGVTFLLLQRRQSAQIGVMNRELESTNDFLASLSIKISRYLSPQIYKSIFSGERDVVVHTERKKLTIFFSDIKDFTGTTERLQPEQITYLLNEYFTAMSAIALKYGGTIDKFVGDAMLIFFGDPETRGEAEDAMACVRMALDMQRRVAELNMKRRNEGIEHPFRVRMGINTGYCNVGNFGSADRMDYTIIGAEANLAARLQQIAEPGQIMLRYETYALVRSILVAHPLPPITMKGISREIIPYVVEGRLGAAGKTMAIFSEHRSGLDFYLDPTMIESGDSEHIRNVLQQALDTLPTRKPQ